MIKLSTMKKVVATVDNEWRSQLVERIIENWDFDSATARFYRASANFICIIQKNEQNFFLRFNDSCERELKLIEGEIKVLNYLRNQSVSVALPLKSIHDRYIEVVETELGIFYAVVFEGLRGKHHKFEDMTESEIYSWGKELGRLHKVLKKLPFEYYQYRPNWQNHLDYIAEIISVKEPAAKNELKTLRNWVRDLETSPENYGLVHFDFELDNLCWNEDEVGILDFDDCAIFWYIADIAYALRDLFKSSIDLQHPHFLKFLEGYRGETSVDEKLLQKIPWFLRLHNLYTFARLVRSVDLSESEDNPDWLNGLIRKLNSYIDNYRQRFKNLHK